MTVPGEGGPGAAPEPAADGLLLPGDLTSVGTYVAASLADSTRKAYARDLAAWSAWCRSRSLPVTLPADPLAVASWLAAMADDGHSPRYVARRLSGPHHPTPPARPP